MATQNESQQSFVGTAPSHLPGLNPAPGVPPQYTYRNTDGQFDVDHHYARGIYHFPLDNSFNDDYFAFSKPLIFNLPEGTILTLVYNVLTADSTFSVAFSQSPLSYPDGQHYPLLYSFDGVNYYLWLTTGGTTRWPLANPVNPPQVTPTSPTNTPTTPPTQTPTTPPTQTTTTQFHHPTGGIQGGPLIQHGDFSSDGRKTVYPIHREQDLSDGSATVDIDETGTFSLTINGHHSGVTGQTDFTAAVIVTGYKNGVPHTVLNQPSSRDLTVTANPIFGANSKSATFTDLPSIAPADIDNVRNVRVLLAANKSGQNFFDVISSAIGAASTLLQEADALYKQWNDSDIGKSVDTAEVGG